MEQKNCVEFTGAEGKIRLFCDSDTALGDLHDFLLMLKGTIVDRMVKAQKEEEAQAAANKVESIEQCENA